METFGKVICKYRVQKQISLRQFAEQIEVSPAFVSKLENDKTEGTATEDTIKKISNVLGISFEWLIALAGKFTEAEVKDRQQEALKFFREDLKTKNERNGD